MTRTNQKRLANARFSADIQDALRPLAVGDNWHALSCVLMDYALIAAAVALGQTSLWLYPFAVLVIGSRQRALTTILHDAAHGRAARSRWLNRLVGTYLSGYLIFQAFLPYRQSHVVGHHGHLGETGHDPDFQLYLDAGLYSGITPAQFFWRQVVPTLFLANALGYLWYVTKHRSIALIQSKRELLALTLLWAAIFATLTALDGWRLFLLYWLVPYVTSFAIIGRFIEIAEHYPMLGAGAADSILHSTRNRFSHPLEAMFFSMHGENYHLVHHLRPDIPFWNARKAHRKMMEDPDYRRVNEQFGGIFLSSNGRPAVIPALVTGRLPLPSRVDPGGAAVSRLEEAGTPY